MKVTMMVDDFALRKTIQYSDPDYDLIFYNCDGSEISLGIYVR